jgi:hypothetical protein
MIIHLVNSGDDGLAVFEAWSKLGKVTINRNTLNLTANTSIFSQQVNKRLRSLMLLKTT